MKAMTDPKKHFEESKGRTIEEAFQDDIEDQESEICAAAQECAIDIDVYNQLIDAGFTDLAEKLDTLTAEIEIQTLLNDE
jgi:hypothetical protein